MCGGGAPAMMTLLSVVVLLTSTAAPPPTTPPLAVPAHFKYMSAYGYNASAQAPWCTFAKSFNLSQLVEGFTNFGLPGLYRIDCVGCEGSQAKSPGFAAGIICDLPVSKRPPGRNPYHFCEKVSAWQ